MALILHLEFLQLCLYRTTFYHPLGRGVVQWWTAHSLCVNAWVWGPDPLLWSQLAAAVHPEGAPILGSMPPTRTEFQAPGIWPGPSLGYCGHSKGWSSETEDLSACLFVLQIQRNTESFKKKKKVVSLKVFREPTVISIPQVWEPILLHFSDKMRETYLH